MLTNFHPSVCISICPSFPRNEFCEWIFFVCHKCLAVLLSVSTRCLDYKLSIIYTQLGVTRLLVGTHPPQTFKALPDNLVLLRKGMTALLLVKDWLHDDLNLATSGRSLFYILSKFYLCIKVLVGYTFVLYWCNHTFPSKQKLWVKTISSSVIIRKN